MAYARTDNGGAVSSLHVQSSGRARPPIMTRERSVKKMQKVEKHFCVRSSVKNEIFHNHSHNHKVCQVLLRILVSCNDVHFPYPRVTANPSPPPLPYKLSRLNLPLLRENKTSSKTPQHLPSTPLPPNPRPASLL